MARPKGGQKIMAMAKAGAAKRAARKRAPRSRGISSGEEGYNASELGGKRWERSWAKTRAKYRKMTSGLREQYAKNVAKNKRRSPSK